MTHSDKCQVSVFSVMSSASIENDLYFVAMTELVADDVCDVSDATAPRSGELAACSVQAESQKSWFGITCNDKTGSFLTITDCLYV